MLLQFMLSNYIDIIERSISMSEPSEYEVVGRLSTTNFFSEVMLQHEKTTRYDKSGKLANFTSGCAETYRTVSYRLSAFLCKKFPLPRPFNATTACCE